jgi:hypothetical protein
MFHKKRVTIRLWQKVLLQASGSRKFGYAIHVQQTGEYLGWGSCGIRRCDVQYGHLTSGGGRLKPVPNRSTVIDRLYLLVTSKASGTSDAPQLLSLKHSTTVSSRCSCRPRQYFQTSHNPNTRLHKSLCLNQYNEVGLKTVHLIVN